MLPPLRERVARVLFEEPHNSAIKARSWATLSDEKRRPWLADADAVIAVVLDAVKRVVVQRNPANHDEYLIERSRLADVITSTLWGDQDGFECPIGNPDCRSNCGAYACHN